MTPTVTLLIKSNSALTGSHHAVCDYVDALIGTHDSLRHYRNALIDIVNTENDDIVQLYDVPAMDGDFVSSTNGTRLLWMPDIGRAALSIYQAGDWQWTDASSPEDALRRYCEDDMAP